jgi:hypothetical protein
MSFERTSERFARYAGEGVECVALALGIDDVVKEGSKLGVRQGDTGIGDSLHQFFQIEFGPDQGAGPVEDAEGAPFLLVNLLACFARGDVLDDPDHAGDLAVAVECAPPRAYPDLPAISRAMNAVFDCVVGRGRDRILDGHARLLAVRFRQQIAHLRPGQSRTGLNAKYVGGPL